MATSSHDGGGATGEGKSLGARRARLNQLKADPLPSARPPPEEIVFGTGRPAPRLRGRAALGPSPISNVDSRAAVDRGATLPPAKKGEGDGSGKSPPMTSPWTLAGSCGRVQIESGARCPLLSRRPSQRARSVSVVCV